MEAVYKHQVHSVTYMVWGKSDTLNLLSAQWQKCLSRPIEVVISVSDCSL